MIADCDFGLRRAITSVTGQLNQADAKEHTRGKDVNDLVLDGKASFRDFKKRLENLKYTIQVEGSPHIPGTLYDRRRHAARSAEVDGLKHIPLLLVIGSGLRPLSDEMPKFYILDSWTKRAVNGTGYHMLDAMCDFIAELENRSDDAQLRHNTRDTLTSISVDAGANRQSKAGYPTRGVINGCPFVGCRLDGADMGGRKDLLSGLMYKLGLSESYMF